METKLMTVPELLRTLYDCKEEIQRVDLPVERVVGFQLGRALHVGVTLVELKMHSFKPAAVLNILDTIRAQEGSFEDFCAAVSV